jgi:hypothetical protein
METEVSKKSKTWFFFIPGNYDVVAGSGKVSVGDRQALGTLHIENDDPFTIKGEVNLGRIEISN